MPRRDRLEIVLNLLEFCEGEPGANKTKIVHFVGLNFRTGGRYLDQLVERELLINSGDGYRLTDKGISIMEDIRQIERIISMEEKPSMAETVDRSDKKAECTEPA